MDMQNSIYQEPSKSYEILNWEVKRNALVDIWAIRFLWVFSVFVSIIAMERNPWSSLMVFA